MPSTSSDRLCSRSTSMLTFKIARFRSMNLLSTTMNLSQPREPWQCRYRGAICSNARALKVDGTLHHLCDEHRSRANQNQRRSKDRKRGIRNRTVAGVTPFTRRPGSSYLRCLNSSEWQDVLEALMPIDLSPRSSSGASVIDVLPDEQLFGPLLAQLSGDGQRNQTAFTGEALWVLDDNLQLPNATL